MKQEGQQFPILVTGGEMDIFVGDILSGSVTSAGEDETIVDVGYVVHVPASETPDNTTIGRIALVRVVAGHPNHGELIGSIERLIPEGERIPSRYET
jgi:ribosomal protein S1